MRRLLLVAVALLVTILLAACGGSGPTATPRPSVTAIPPSATPRPTSTPVVVPRVETDPALRAQFRVIDASADLPPVDVYLDAALVGSQFTEGSYTTQPLSFSAGTYTLRVVASDAEAGAPPLLDYALILNAGESQILLLLGPPDEPSIIPYAEDLSGLPVNTARISAIHAVPGGQPFDVWMEAGMLFGGLEFGTPGGPETVEAGAHHVEFRRGLSVFRAMDVQIGQRIAYTFVLVGADEDSQIITVQSQVQLQAEVRVVHAAQGAPAVDMLLDDETLASGLGYGTWTEWQTSQAQARTLRVVPAGGGDPLYETPVTLRPDRALDLIVIGTPDELSVAQVEEDRSPTPQNAARFVFVNAAPDSARVTTSTFSGPVEGVPPLDYGFGSVPVQMVEHQVSYIFATAADGTLVGRTDDQQWAAGHTYTLIATGDSSGRPLLLDAEAGTNDTVLSLTGAVTASDAGMEHYNLRVINARLDGGPVDVLLGDEAIAVSVQPGTASGYADVTRGTLALTVRDTASGGVLLENDYEPPIDVTEATLFVYDQGDAVQIVTASDNPYGPLDDQAWLRVFHANPNQPDLQLNGQGPTAVETGPNAVPTPEETPLPPEVALVGVARYGEPTTAEPVLAGTYRMHVLNAGTNFRIYTDPLVTLKAGVFYDLLILPDATGLSLQLVPIPRE